MGASRCRYLRYCTVREYMYKYLMCGEDDEFDGMCLVGLKVRMKRVKYLRHGQVCTPTIRTTRFQLFISCNKSLHQYISNIISYIPTYLPTQKWLWKSSA